MPKISVIVPMFNSEKFIQTCIDSILQQTFKDFELIVIDNCSTDRSCKIIEKYSDPRIKLHRNKKNSVNLKIEIVNLHSQANRFTFFKSIREMQFFLKL